MPFTRITALWTGAAGLPGFSRFRFDTAMTGAEAAAAASRVRAFFEAIKTSIPSGISITFDGVATVFSDVGVQTGIVAYTPPANVSGGAAGTYSAPAGGVINWLTGLFHGGRQIRGRTFLVPLGSGAFQSDGTIATATLSAVLTAGNALLGGGPPMIVFSNDGAGFTAVTPVTGCNMPDRAAVLRSRRD